jgi:hypothetical protein
MEYYVPQNDKEFVIYKSVNKRENGDLYLSADKLTLCDEGLSVEPDFYVQELDSNNEKLANDICWGLNNTEAIRAYEQYLHQQNLFKNDSSLKRGTCYIEIYHNLLMIYSDWCKVRKLLFPLQDELFGKVKGERSLILKYIEACEKNKSPKPTLENLFDLTKVPKSEWSKLLGTPHFILALRDELIKKKNQSKSEDKRELWIHAIDTIDMKVTKIQLRIGRRREQQQRELDIAAGISGEDSELD